MRTSPGAGAGQLYGLLCAGKDMISTIKGCKMNSNKLLSCHVSGQTVRRRLQRANRSCQTVIVKHDIFSLFQAYLFYLFSRLFFLPPFHFNCKSWGYCWS